MGACRPTWRTRNSVRLHHLDFVQSGLFFPKYGFPGMFSQRSLSRDQGRSGEQGPAATPGSTTKPDPAERVSTVTYAYRPYIYRNLAIDR